MIPGIKSFWRGLEIRTLAHLREFDESLKDWQRYQNISLEDLKKTGIKEIWFFMLCWLAFRQL
jgi:hypothetical protein